MRSTQNLKKFHSFQTTLHIHNKEKSIPTSQKIPKNIMAMIGYYTVITPSTLENTIELIDFLVSSPIDIDKARLENEKNTIENAFENGDFSFTSEATYVKGALDCIKDVVKNKEQAILYRVLGKANEHVILTLLKNDVFNLNTSFDLREFGGYTPLYIASSRGFAKTTKYLLEKGVNINDKDDFGRTALIGAAFCGQKEILKTLLRQGAIINDKMSEDITALLCAAMEGETECVRLLLENGANINDKTIYGVTALMYSAALLHPHCVEILLKNRAVISDTHVSGCTTLMGMQELPINFWSKDYKNYHLIIAMLLKAHMHQFYEEAIVAEPRMLEPLLAKQRSYGANITRDEMCKSFLTFVEKTEHNGTRISLLYSALGENAYGVFMRQPDRYTWKQTSSAVAKIRSELERYINEMPANESSKRSLM